MMDAIVVVPSYLDRLQAGHHDLPILLLPVINELRAAYNANIVSEATLFAPSLDVPVPELDINTSEHKPAFDESFPEFTRRMRRQWENSLLRWLQKQQDIDLLAPLLSVCETLHCRLERLDLRRLWWIASKVIGGLLDGVTENDMHLRRLFARLHLNLKTLSEGGEEATEVEAADALSQALLFHIAQAKPGSAGVDQLRERFQLQELVPDRDVLIRARGAVTGRNRELYISLGAAVRDELSLVKDALDLELRTGVIQPESREHSHEALLRLQDTLKMMGLGDSAQSIQKLIPAFEASEGKESDSDQSSRKKLLMELAGELIRVESVLEEQITSLGEPLLEDQETSYINLPGHEMRRIHTHLLGETVTSLHQVQDGVRRHFEGDSEADFNSPMEHIAGAMELMGEPETAFLALKLRNALGNLLRHARSEAAVAPDKLETVTDAVAAFELYLAGCRDQQSNRGRFFEILKERLDHLPVGEMEAVKVIPTPPAKAPAKDSQTSETASASGPATVDPELLEVFLEEYESVADMLAKRVPEWMKYPEKSALLTEIRRGFHTLKGSGRMVGADEVGDFAWHIESLINTLLEGSIDSLDNVALIVQISEAVLPAMKQRLQQQPSELTAAAIEAIGGQADRIAAGKETQWSSLSETLPRSIGALLPGAAKFEAATAYESDRVDDRPRELTLKELVCKELGENLAVLAGLMERISRDRSITANDAEIIAIHTIAGTTALDPLNREPDVAKALEGFLEAQRQSGMAFSDTAMWTVATSLAHFETCLAVHENDPEAELAGDEESQIEQLIALTVEFEVPRPEQQDPEPEKIGVEDEAVIESGDESEEQEDRPVETVPDPVDNEILVIFLEEANDVLARCDSLLNTWRDNLSDLDIVQNLQREIHTFKGGARMAGINSLGTLAHSMETLLERIAGQSLPSSVSAIEVLEQGCDRLNAWTQQVMQGAMPEAGEALRLFNKQVDALTAVPLQPTVKTEEPARIDTAPEELQDIPDVVVPVSEREVSEELPTESPGSQQIRVNADLLDSLVNSAGEISIFRSHLEQQVGHIRDNLKEFDGTVSRLREQFRKLEIETERLGRVRSTGNGSILIHAAIVAQPDGVCLRPVELTGITGHRCTEI